MSRHTLVIRPTPEQVLDPKYEKSVILMRGHPGSGKSTWVCQHAPIGSLVCSADYAFTDAKTGEYYFDASRLHEAHDMCYNVFKQAIDAGHRVIIVDNTNIRRKEYRRYTYYALKNNYEIYQKVMTGNYTSVHDVPLSKIQQMKEHFENDPKIPHWEN